MNLLLATIWYGLKTLQVAGIFVAMWPGDESLAGD
jgi:hypothetical protein